jgi:chemotaxis protein histidine kinase CheA
VKYFKEAFNNRWNLLAFIGGAVFSLLSGKPDVFLPLVAALELGYVGLLGSHPKFRAYVDAQEAKALRELGSQSSQKVLSYILRMLPRDLMKKFDDLRLQCAELRQIASELKNPGKTDSSMPLDNLQAAGLDRLLWIYLRLLYTQFSLARFLQKTNSDQIAADIQKMEQRLKQLPTSATPQNAQEAESDSRMQRMQKTLEDSLQTSRDRMANLTKAKENYQLIQLEIERLENKIRSLSEVAVNRQEPNFISTEVDHVATSMMDTEKTMNDLQFATGLDTCDDQTPQLLEVVQAQSVR